MAKSKKQTNDLEKIEAYFTTENEHYNGFTLDIYNEAKENNLFPDIETPLWIFDNATNEFYESRNKPLQVLNELKETFTKEKLNNEQQAFILEHLIDYFKNTIYTEGESKNEISLSKVEKLLKKELEQIKPTKANKTETEYNWNKTIIHLETLPELKDRIVYLIEQKTRYKQESGYDFEHPNFGEKCELEIKKLKALIEIQNSTVPQTKQAFQLRKKQGAKTDLIRILNAVYELKMFEMIDGQIPSKEMFMKQAGDFFGTDLSKYDIDLSQALNNTSLEANIKVFEQMKEVTQNSHYIGKKEK
jgi:hypothetical protein